MERKLKDKHFSKEYTPVVLWQDDLEELVTTLRRLGKEPTIETNDYSFDSIEDLAKRYGPQPQAIFAGKRAELKIATSDPYCVIEFTRRLAKVWVSGSDPRSAIIYHEVDDILSRCQRPFSFAYSSSIGFWLMALSAINMGLTVWVKTPQVEYLLAIISTAGLALALWAPRALYVSFSAHSQIRLQHRAAATSFFGRNRDSMLMILISLVIGGVLTFIGTRLTERFLPKTDANSVVPTNK